MLEKDVSELKEKLRKIDNLIKIAQTREEYESCQDLYSFLGIDREKIAKEFIGKRSTIEDILLNNRSKYDDYLKEKSKTKLAEFFDIFTRKDKELQPDEEESLIEEGDKLGLDQSEVTNFINELLRACGARRGTLDALVRNHYEMLNVPEDADYKKIKAAYDREHQKYIKSRDKAKANAKFHVVSEAWECLRDPDKKREYDEEQRRKREKGLTREGAPKLEIVDESGKEKRRFEFKDMKLGDSSSVTVIAKNGGGGTLDAKIVTSCPWLIVDTDKVHQSKLPQHITIKVDPKKHKKKNCLGGHDEGFIEISYPEAAQREKVYVKFSIEVEEEALSSFRKSLTLGGLALGGLFGYLVYNMNFIQGMNENIAGIAGILAVIVSVIVAGKLGYQDEGVGAAIGWGCGSLIGVIILFWILGSYFPHALSVCSWTLAYGSLAYVVSSPIRRALWEKNLVLPITIGVLTLALTGGIVLAGFISAKQEGREELARSKAQLIRSKAIQKKIQATRRKLPGEWYGTQGKNKIKLNITRRSNQLSGKMLHYKYGVEQKLSVNFRKKAAQIIIILKGTSYKHPKGGKYYLDTFYGTLSRDGRTIKGTYKDTHRNKGKWSVSRVGSVAYMGSLFVETDPPGARIKILNIGPKFYQGMKLGTGRYQVEVSAHGYKTRKTWIKLGAGEERRLNVSLVKIKEVGSVTTETKYKKVLEKEKRPAGDDSVRSLPPPPTY